MRKFLVVCCLALIAAGAERSSDLARETAKRIRTAATTRNNDAEAGHPLPLASSWFTGAYTWYRAQWGLVAETMTPAVQLRYVEAGHYVLPSVMFPPGNFSVSEHNRTAIYYSEPFAAFRELGMPISVVGTQWESVLSSHQEYTSLPLDENPNCFNESGHLQSWCLSPVGGGCPTLWEEVGRKTMTSETAAKLQELFPEPPLVLFVSNNEMGKLSFSDANTDPRFVALYGNNTTADARRQIFGDAWIQRYQAMINAMRGNITSPAWHDNSVFVGYSAFGGAFAFRWGGWTQYSLHTPGRFSPWPFCWDGATPSYYINDWDSSADFWTWSPQIQGMNWVFMLEETMRNKPDFWWEISVWDGDKAKREWYASLNQTFTPDRYKGTNTFGLWLVRPRVLREFRGWTALLNETEEYFLRGIVEPVDEVQNHPLLRQFWRFGKLVANHKHTHPYQSNMLPEYAEKDRWFLLDVSTNDELVYPLGLSTPIPVFSLAILVGAAPSREWLLYLHSPLQSYDIVEVAIPEYDQRVTASSTPGGVYYHVVESKQTCVRVEMVSSFVPDDTPSSFIAESSDVSHATALIPAICCIFAAILVF